MHTKWHALVYMTHIEINFLKEDNNYFEPLVINI